MSSELWLVRQAGLEFKVTHQERPGESRGGSFCPHGTARTCSRAGAAQGCPVLQKCPQVTKLVTKDVLE